jgi:hypothetical protein
VATDPQLIVALEARLDKFEKGLKEAGIIAEQQIKEIEAKFAGMEITPGKIAGGVAAGNVIFKFLDKAVEGFIAKITEAIEQMNNLNDAMTKTTLSAEQLQRVGFAARAGGLTDKEFFAGLDRAGAAMDEMNRRTTKLGELLDANNIKYKDQAGLVVNVDRGLELAAELMSRAGSEFEKIEIAKAFGLTEQWVRVLGQGVEHFRAMKAAATIDENLARSLQHMEALRTLAAEIRAIIGGWGNDLVQLVLPNLKLVSDALTVALETLARITQTGVLEQQTAALLERWKGIAAAIDRANTAATGPLRLTVNKPSQVIQPAEAKDAFDRQIESIEKHIAVMKADALAVGLGAAAQEELRTEALLTEALIRAGIEINDQYAETITKIAERAGQAKGQLEALKAAQAELNSASKEFGSALAEGFKAAVLQGQKLDEVLKNLANRMASKAIDKLFDLLFATTSGQGTSIFNKLLGIGVTGRMAGGPLAAGQAAIVGERGPELFIPKNAGMVVPNNAMRGASGPVEVKIINNTMQPVAKQERQGPSGRVLEVTVGRMVRETISADLFQGGDIDRAMRTRFGLTPRLA